MEVGKQTALKSRQMSEADKTNSHDFVHMLCGISGNIENL